MVLLQAFYIKILGYTKIMAVWQDRQLQQNVRFCWAPRIAEEEILQPLPQDPRITIKLQKTLHQRITNRPIYQKLTTCGKQPLSPTFESWCKLPCGKAGDLVSILFLLQIGCAESVNICLYFLLILSQSAETAMCSAICNQFGLVKSIINCGAIKCKHVRLGVMPR